ncbi:uncharacterized protein PGRI_075240 [Penicillium griseofulvum]|uniref:Peptidase A2 domain-containing protein n=1 Tax=Penicillium patulum TaxID=5078 RepID=A0A135LZJ6_PENPA|nr:uncharacterized protein PGRI_075240 [Penicillium griseofulvum]KXG54380.1 hypothetical protein PGRI_075240 [Penicillium griseofulvum]
MELLNTYRPSTVLGQVSKNLDNRHSDLSVTLFSNHVPYEEALTATLNCVRGLPGRILLPTTNPVRRAQLRKMALQEMSNDPTHSSSSQLIRTAGKLTPEDLPQSASPHRRALLKQKLQNENTSPRQDPYVLPARSLLEQNKLAAVLGNIVVTAMDFEEGLPKFQLEGVRLLWDTGAANTIITKDLFDDKFQAYLSDPIHQPYIHQGESRVQVSFSVEFTNTLFSMDIIAVVVDQHAVPNGRSGIILGQAGCIDALQYRSIPRAIIQAKGESIEEKYWGELILESYVDVDGDLKAIVG